MARLFGALAAICFLAQPAVAQTEFCGEGPLCQPPSFQLGNSVAKESHIYLGLVWEINRSTRRPDVVVGYRKSRVNSSNTISGVDLSAKLRAENDTVNLDSVRLLGLVGSPEWVGTLGAGYSFEDNSVLVSGGIQHGHLRGSVDFTPDNAGLKYFIEVNTLQEPKKPAASGATCPAGTTAVEAFAGQDTSAVVEGSSVTITPAAPQILGGITCVSFPP